MEYTKVENLKWAGTDIIEMDVTFDNVGAVPFAARADDVEPHGRDLYSRAVAGDFGPIEPWPDADQLAAAQAAKTSELRTAHNTELTQGVTSNGHTFALGTLRDEFNITAMAAAVQAGLPIAERPKLPTIGGPRVELTDAEVVDLATALHDTVAANANKLGDKLEAVELATTVAEVEAITWMT